MTYIEKIAQAIHREAFPDQSMDSEERDLYLIYAVLALTIGEMVTKQHVHDAWSAWKTRSDPNHEAVVPFDQLGADKQEEDRPYVEAIRQIARRIRERGDGRV